MTAAGHIITGGSIGLIIASSLEIESIDFRLFVLVSLVGIFSHYVFDAIPHGHYKNSNVGSRDRVAFLRVALDFLFGTLLVMLLPATLGANSATLLLIALAASAALLPDILQIYSDVVQTRARLLRLHYWFHSSVMHWQGDIDVPDGRRWTRSDLWQIAPLLAFVLMCFRYL